MRIKVDLQPKILLWWCSVLRAQVTLTYMLHRLLIQMLEKSLKTLSLILQYLTQNVEYMKVSRGEENIFIWCFFLSIAQLAIDEQVSYKWVKYIYIDDPISSLDDNNAIAVASHLAQMLKRPENKVKAVISTHHTLFFNVMYNEMGNALKCFLSKGVVENSYMLKDTTDTPFFHHVSLLKDLKKAADSGNLYTYHFNILRSVLEKTATLHGLS